MARDMVFEVLRSRAEHDLGECARRFTEAGRVHGEQVAFQQRCQAAIAASRAEMARIESAGVINVVTYDLGRRLHHADRVRGAEAQVLVADAAEALERQRVELARLRQLESGLRRAIERRGRDDERARGVREEALVDDLWLQAARRGNA